MKKYIASPISLQAFLFILVYLSLYLTIFSQLPVDSEGWTIFSPSADSRIIYVSSTSGNDTTAQYYLPSDAEIGADPFNPVGAIMPFRTIAAARTNMREYFPDWLLLNRGDVWFEPLSPNLQRFSGRSRTEVSLYSSYGTGSMPLLKTGINIGFGLSSTPSWETNTTDNIAIAHIEFYAHTRDPNSSDFDTGTGGVQGGSSGFRIVKSGSNFTIEGCKFSYYTNNSIQKWEATEQIVNFRLRRNVIAYNYRNTSGGSHSQGIFAGGGVDSMLIEENVFWHNGWSDDPIISGTANGAPATVFNRNAYLAREQKDLIVRGNIFTESASEAVQQRSGGLFEDNLSLKNSAGVLFGQNQATWPTEAVSGVVRNNVTLDAQDIDGSPRGWGIRVEQVDSVHLYQNIVAHQKSGTGNIQGISLGFNYLNLTIENNVVYDWTLPNPSDPNDVRSTTLYISALPYDVNTIIKNNDFQQPSLGFVAKSGNPVPTGIFWSNNKYNSVSPNPPTIWSSGWFGINNSVTYADWVTATGDSTSIFEQIAYIDPSRTIESYMTAQGGTPSLDAFMQETLKQRKGFWRDEYTSYTVNCYIREGFQTPITFNALADTITICAGSSTTLSIANLNIDNYSISWDDNFFGVDTSFTVSPLTSRSYTMEVIDSNQRWKMCSPITHSFYVIVDVCLGTMEEENEKDDLHVYPNPSHGDLMIENFTKTEKLKSISIYNAFGNEVYVFSEEELRDIKLSNRVNIGDDLNQSGMYMIKINTIEKNYMEKILLIK